MARLRFTAALGAAICAGLAEGKSLRAVSKGKGMPDHSTVMGWLRDEDKAEFAAQYDQARTIGYWLLHDELIEIADGKGDTNDKRVRIDTRKWMLAKMLPKFFGDKLDVAHSGSLDLVTTLTEARQRAGLDP